MRAGKFLRKWLPVAVAASPLLISLGGLVLDSMSSGSPPPKGVPTELWDLLLPGEKTLQRSFLLSLTLVGFLATLTSVDWRTEDIWAVVKEVPRSRILPLPGGDEGLDQLTIKIKHAKEHILLMYLRPDPVHDAGTREYWEKTTKLFIGKTETHVPIQRMASIDDKTKLEFLLENNSSLFKLGGGSIRQVKYQLRAFPHTLFKPLRVDVIDDTAFMFSTYGSQIMVTEEKIVRECHKYHQQLWDNLTDWTVFDTTAASKLTMPGRTEYGYSPQQLNVIVKVIRDLLKEGPSKSTFALIEQHCELTWDEFRNLF